MMSNRNGTAFSIAYVQRKRIFGIFIDQANAEMVTTNRIAFGIQLHIFPTANVMINRDLKERTLPIAAALRKKISID